MGVKEILPGFYEIGLYIPKDGFKDFITAWLIRDKKRSRTVLVETGPASASERLMEDLNSLGADRIDYLLYTHIHMDHSGGAGQFSAKHPETKISVPSRGRRHLVSPEALYEGSVKALGKDLINAYGEPVPLPESALAPDPLALDGLTAIHTPGHAPHHDSYLYDLDGVEILFAGEAAGYHEEFGDGSVYSRPATPVRFFYDVAMNSLNTLKKYQNADLVCFPHRGFSRDCASVFERAEKQTALWKDIISSMPPDASPEDCVAELKSKDPYMANSDKLSPEGRVREDFFLKNSAAGYLDYIHG